MTQSNAQIVLLATAVARVLVAILLPEHAESVDMHHWREVASILQSGGNPYVETTHLNWPPVWMILLRFCGFLGQTISVDLHTSVQLVLGCADLMIALTLYQVLRQGCTNEQARNLVLIGYSCNPICLLLSTQHAQFDLLVGCTIFLCAHSTLKFIRTQNPSDWLFSCLWLGLGISLKTVPLVLIPLLTPALRSLDRKTLGLGIFVLLTPIVFSLGTLYALAPTAVSQKVLAYASIPGYFGITGLLSLIGFESASFVFYGKLFFAIALASMAGCAAYLKEREVSERSYLYLFALLMLLIPLFGPGFGRQYIGWLVPLFIVLYAQSEARVQSSLRFATLIAAATYLLEYGVNLDLGSYAYYGSLIHRETAQILTTPSYQTLTSLPLFFAGLWVFIQLSRSLRDQSRM